MDHGDSGIGTRRSNALLAAAVGFVLVLCSYLALPFLPVLVWSFTLAVLAHPLAARLNRRVGSPGGAAALATAVVSVAIVIPIVLVGSILLAEAVRSAATIAAMIDESALRKLSGTHPWLAPALQWLDERIDIPAMLQGGAEATARRGAAFVGGAAYWILGLLLSLYFLFYFLRDGRTAKAALAAHAPLTGDEFDHLASRVVATVKATVYGTLVVAALQGSLAGAMFWWLGLPAPVFWGVLMGLLAIVPFLGAFVVWAPVAAYLALSGDLSAALLLAGWGLDVVGLVDNIVFPILVGRQLVLHTLTSFIAIVGGLILFGSHGVILGPVLATSALTLLPILRRRLDHGSGSERDRAAP